jgi:hypothetical protein
MQELGGVVVKFGQGDEAGITTLVITNPDDERAKAGRDELREILNLNPDTTEYVVEYGGSPANDTEIAIVTRSVFDIMAEVALAAEVPQKDVEEGRAYPHPPLLQDPNYKPIASIHSNQSLSTDAVVAVHYRNLWFWIDDRDLESKKVLSTLLLMVNLAESGGPASAPLVTIPAG